MKTMNLKLLCLVMIILMVFPSFAPCQNILLDKDEISIGFFMGHIPKINTNIIGMNLSFSGKIDFGYSKAKNESDFNGSTHKITVLSCSYFPGSNSDRKKYPVRASINLSHVTGEENNNFTGLGLSVYYISNFSEKLYCLPNLNFGVLLKPRLSKDIPELVVGNSSSIGMGAGFCLKDIYGFNLIVSPGYMTSRDFKGFSIEAGLSFNFENGNQSSR